MKKGRQSTTEAQSPDATSTPANCALKPKVAMPGSPKKGRQRRVEAQADNATSAPATDPLKPTTELPGSLNSIVEAIRAHHRERRFAMGIQQVLDRKLESFIRINKTDWHVGDDEAAREKANKEVAAKIKAARNGEGDPSIIMIVELTDKARAPADTLRARHEKEMEMLAKQLPVAAWVEAVPGLGFLGLATIIAETGDLALYPNVAKVWKRLGYAPFDGLAGSSWKRQSWRDGRPALTAEQWTENPFSGRRYALIHTISVWLKNKQWIGAAKTDDGVGKPNGRYGEIYAARRARTAQTHADWSKQHSHMDALRIMMKEVLKDLWIVWNGVERKPQHGPDNSGRQSSLEARTCDATATPASLAMKPSTAMPGSPIPENGRQYSNEAQHRLATATPATDILKPMCAVPGSPIIENGRHSPCEAQGAVATATPAKHALKPNETVPGSPIENGRQMRCEAQRSGATASPARHRVKPNTTMPGSPIQIGRQCAIEAHTAAATATPANGRLKPNDPVPGSPIIEKRSPAPR